MKDFKRRSRFADDMRVALTALVLLLLVAGCTLPPPAPAATPTPTPGAQPLLLRFDGADAYRLAAAQVLHPDGSTRFRVPNSTGNDQVARWASEQLNASGWNVSWQGFTATYGCAATPMHNVVAQRMGHSDRIVILGAHYDTRPVADSDANVTAHDEPIPGANDGASGVAVLLELAKVLPPLNDTVRIVLFDGEDGGGYKGDACTSWLLGSQAYAASLDAMEVKSARAMVLVDMAGDPAVRMPRELSSTRDLQDRIYAVGAGLGYGDVFLNATRYDETYTIEDDHKPFLDRGIPSVDLIHLEPGIVFPEWHHTLHDDMTHVSASSLAKVGRTLEQWLREG